jgi:hypothetical protein
MITISRAREYELNESPHAETNIRLLLVDCALSVMICDVPCCMHAKQPPASGSCRLYAWLHVSAITKQIATYTRCCLACIAPLFAAELVSTIPPPPSQRNLSFLSYRSRPGVLPWLSQRPLLDEPGPGTTVKRFRFVQPKLLLKPLSK